MQPFESLGKMPIMERKIKVFLGRLANYAKQEGIRIALVGGSVRDMLLGRDSFDIDIVLEADAIDFVRHWFPSSKKRVYKYFRTCSVWTDIGRVDFATARTETYPSCASRPLITPARLEDDLFRRDFTINAMAILLKATENVFGQLIDIHGGKNDLSRGVLDVLHPRSFCDDPIRILRGIRYVVRFGFRFSDRCLELIKEARDKGYINLVPRDRLVDEYHLIQKEPIPERVFEEIKRYLGIDFCPL